MNDIDFAIARSWTELQKDIQQFFAKQNVTAGAEMLLNRGVRLKFGMMKLTGTTKDAEKWNEEHPEKEPQSASDFDLDLFS